MCFNWSSGRFRSWQDAHVKHLYSSYIGRCVLLYVIPLQQHIFRVCPISVYCLLHDSNIWNLKHYLKSNFTVFFLFFPPWTLKQKRAVRVHIRWSWTNFSPKVATSLGSQHQASSVSFSAVFKGFEGKLDAFKSENKHYAFLHIKQHKVFHIPQTFLLNKYELKNPTITLLQDSNGTIKYSYVFSFVVHLKMKLTFKITSLR